MSKKDIVSVGIEIPGVETEYSRFNETKSLADADIVLFSPYYDTSMYSNVEYGNRSNYKGLPNINSDDSFKLKRDSSYWKRELKNFIESGKTVFFILENKIDYYVNTGEKKTSGTGRNQKVTTIVDLFNNYSCLPIEIGKINQSVGKKLAYKDKNSYLRPLWDVCSAMFEYKVFVDDFSGETLFFQKTTNNSLGGIIKMGKGHLVLLPYLDLEEDDFTDWKHTGPSGYDGEEVWSKKAIQFEKQFLSSLFNIDKALNQNEDIGALPEWIDEPKFDLPLAAKTSKELVKILDDIEKLIEQKAVCENRLKLENEPKLLLCGNGKALERSVRRVLELLGFSATSYEEGDSEFDVVFESKEGRFLGEVEGKDTKAVAVGKFSQLLRNLGEDFNRDEVYEPAKGVLFGNGKRMTKVNERAETFTDKCVSGAKQSNIALVNTYDLFDIYKYLSQKKNSSFSKKCREKILKTSGVVVFPKIPSK